MNEFRVLPGLPAYGPPAVSFPAGWGHGAREGLVVEFQPSAGAAWVGNFDPGDLRDPSDVRLHPNGRDVLVTCARSLWHVHTDTRTADLLASPVLGWWQVSNPDGFVYDNGGLSLVRVGPAGVLWHTRRISWDGFERITIDADRLAGQSWSPTDDAWIPFTIDLANGDVTGGSYSGPEIRFDDASAPRRFTAGWVTIGVSLVLVLARYGAMPDAVPAFVSLTGEATAVMPKSLLAVARVPLMGAGQLLAVTALNRFRTASRLTTAWPRFFRALATAVAAKTLLESAALSGTGTAWGDAITFPLQVVTIVIVFAFIVYGVRLWRAGLLEAVPSVAPRAAYVELTIGIALWLALALVPYVWISRSARP